MKKLDFFILTTVAAVLLSVGSALAAVGSGSTTADLDLRDYTVVVVSAHGNPTPAIGSHTYARNATFTASVGVLAGGYICTGWTGTGSIPATGNAQTTSGILLDQVSSVIEWQWTTNSFTVSFDTKGGVTSDPVNKGVTYGSAYGALATTSRAGYTFGGWWTATGTEVTAATPVTMAYDHTLYAKWTVNYTVSNVTAAQRPGTKLVDITYDLASTETNVGSVSLAVMNGAAMVPAASLTGDTGVNVTTGTGRRIVWDMGADWSGNVAAGVTFTVTVVPPPPPEGGDLTAISWEKVNERWVKNTYVDGAITMSDRNTGLMWVYDAGANGTADWGSAQTHCNDLIYAGHSDWFLPDFGQLDAMYSQRAFFTGVQTYYWSSTPSSATSAWCFIMATNWCEWNMYGRSINSSVWPCRSRQ